MKCTYIKLLLICFSTQLLAQNEDKTEKEKINFFAYIDVFYNQDFNNPIDRKQLYSSNPFEVNQFGMDYAFIQGSYKNDKLEANLAINYGGIVEVMYVNEPEQYKFIREASIKYHLTDKFNIEAGIMPALFGFETFINLNNMHATRAVMCDFAPDFAAGVTFSYKLNKHWTNKFQINNGWQVIEETNNSKAFANVLIYENEKNKNLINFGLIYADESEDTSTAQPRFFSNNFAKIHFKKWIIAPMIDFGFQKAGDLTINHNNSNSTLMWYSTALSIRYEIMPKFGIAGRYERMIDKHCIIPEVVTNTPNGFQMNGGTLTFEYLPTKSSAFRLEGKYKTSKDPIFLSNEENVLKKNDFGIILSFATFLGK
jgi:hypothetical protein